MQHRPATDDAADAPVPATGPRLDRLTTFDCFDTVVTRAVGAPESVAYLTGLRLARDGVTTVSAERYAAARVEAERLVWRTRGDDGTLAHIALQTADLLHLSPEVADALRDTELAVEHEVTREVPGARARIEAARAAGDTVGFLSDTPLPHAVVDGLLRAHGLIDDGDLLWVSNELGAGKNRGTAYAAVARRLGGAPATWTHLGDDARADVRNARLSGVQPVHLPQGRLNRYEKLLERHGAASGGLASVLAGSSRRTRLLLAADRPDIPAGRVDVAAGVAGPLLAGYVLWCLQQAQAAGCRRLYFVARDGEVLLDMARRLVRGLGIDLDLRYLHGSRKAWLLDGDAADRRASLLAVAGRQDRVTVHNTLSWLSVTPEQIEAPLTAAGFPRSSWEDRLDRSGLERLAHVVEDPAVDALLAEQAQERTEAAGGYLRAVGLLDGEPFGIVDMMGRGTTGRFLTDALSRFGGGPPTVELYFGLEEDAHDSTGRTLRGYMYDERRGLGMTQRDVDVWVPLEAFTQARHGQVVGYAEADGAYVPVLAAEVNQPLVDWGLEGLRTALDVYCDELAGALAFADVRGDVRRATWETLRAFWLRPTDAELAGWQDFPLEYEDVTYSMGRGYSPRQMVGSVLRGRPSVRPRGTWPAAVHRGSPAGLRAARASARLASAGVGKAKGVAAYLERRRAVQRRG